MWMIALSIYNEPVLHTLYDIVSEFRSFGSTDSAVAWLMLLAVDLCTLVSGPSRVTPCTFHIHVRIKEDWHTNASQS